MTTKLYDQDSHCRTFSAQVFSCTPVQGGQWHIVLDQTAFFPEGGGQPGDQGTLDTVRVLDTRERGDAIVHITDGPLTPGTSVTGELDWALRFARMQCHSGEHVLSGLAHSLYGCTNVGFHMGEDQVILDFDKELTPQQLTVLEDRANQIITENRPVTARYPAPEELAALDYRSKLDLTEQVRIVTIAGCDVCACCAPHVTCTGEIGLVKLVDAMRHRGGIRLWMVAGRLALADYQRKQTNIAAISWRKSPKPSPRPPATSASLRMAWTEPVSGSWPTRAWNGAGASARSSPARTRPGTATPWAAKPWTSGPRPRRSTRPWGERAAASPP